MHGDFSRDSDQPIKQFTRVLMQQGRLLLDSDWNEQSEIVTRFLRTLAGDLIGWHGGPSVETDGSTPPAPQSGPLLVTKDADNRLFVSGGRYYVDGLMTDLPPSATFVPVERNRESELPQRIVIADLYEQHVTATSDSELLDPALGGLDTTTRTQLVVVFRVVFSEINDPANAVFANQDALRAMPIFAVPSDPAPKPFDARPLNDPILPTLAAWTNLATEQVEHCGGDSATGFSGLENQLYRVEIHDAGDSSEFWNGNLDDGSGGNVQQSFTVKWSRDNGSIVFAAELGNNRAILRTKWRDSSRGISKGDIVELIHQPSGSSVLVEVTQVHVDGLHTEIEFSAPSDDFSVDFGETILVRRWDHRASDDFPLSAGAMLVKASASDRTKSIEIPIEDNIKVQIELPTDAEFRKGDHWLIPARAAVRDILWPRQPDPANSKRSLPVHQPARYVGHHYAPLAIMTNDHELIDLRKNIEPIAK